MAGLAFLAGTGLRGADVTRRLGRAAVVAALVTGAGAAADLAGWAPAGVTFAGGRVGGLLGQPTYLAALALLLGPVAAGVACDPSAGRAWRLAAASGAAGCGLAVIAAQTRGAWLGAAVAAAAGAAAWRAARHNPPRDPVPDPAGAPDPASMATSPGRAVAGPRGAAATRPGQAAAEPQEAAATSPGQAAAGAQGAACMSPVQAAAAPQGAVATGPPVAGRGRGGSWRTVVMGVVAVGVVGVALATVGGLGDRAGSALGARDGGPGLPGRRVAGGGRRRRRRPAHRRRADGYRVAAPAHIDDAYARRHGRDEVVDRAHDAVLDVAAAGGVPAAALYVALLGLVAAGCARALRRPPHPVVAGMAIALVAWLVQQLAAFPIAEVDPVAWLLAGALATAVSGTEVVARQPDAFPKPTGRANRWTQGAAAVLAVVLAAGGALAVRVDLDLADAQRLAADGRPAAALATADRGTRLRPDDIDAWYVAARVASTRGGLLGVDAGLDRVERGRDRFPGDPALRDLEEELLADRALRSGLPGDLAAAEAASRAAISADPANPVHHRRLAAVLALGGDEDGAAAARRRADDLTPPGAEP